MQRLVMMGLNHASSPLALREKVAFSPAQREKAITRFREYFPESEVVILSTCNRMEFYTARPVHSHPRVDEMIEFVAEFHGLDAAQLRPHLYDYTERRVAEHLFAVTSSLDSLVVGETQIIAQVREAYDHACQAGSAGALLHPLFQHAIATAREVLAATQLADGRRSIASIAVDYARQVFDSFADKTVLCIGAGKMSALVLKHLSELHIRTLIVCNRDLEKAQSLASEFGGQAGAMEELPAYLAQADIVVSSTASPQPIITRAVFERVMKQRRWKPVFLIDIALPRDIEPGVGDLENVYLYNIDDLQHVARATDCNRLEAVAAATKIVLQRVDEFVTWHRAREVGPLIERLFARSHAIATEEVLRAANKLPNLSAEEREHLEELARRIVNKLLNDPVQVVRAGDAKNGSNPYVHALTRLFRLEE